MVTRIKIKLYIICIFLSSNLLCKNNKISLINADVQEINIDNKNILLSGNIKFKYGTNYLCSDSATNINNKKIIFWSNPKIYNKYFKIFSKKIEYNIPMKKAILYNNIILSRDNLLKSDTILFNFNSYILKLSGNIILKNNNLEFNTKKMTYDIDKHNISLLDKYHIYTKDNIIVHGDKAIYNTQSKIGYLYGITNLNYDTINIISKKLKIYDNNIKLLDSTYVRFNNDIKKYISAKNGLFKLNGKILTLYNSPILNYNNIRLIASTIIYNINPFKSFVKLKGDVRIKYDNINDSNKIYIKSQEVNILDDFKHIKLINNPQILIHQKNKDLYIRSNNIDIFNNKKIDSLYLNKDVKFYHKKISFICDKLSFDFRKNQGIINNIFLNFNSNNNLKAGIIYFTLKDNKLNNSIMYNNPFLIREIKYNNKKYYDNFKADTIYILNTNKNNYELKLKNKIKYYLLLKNKNYPIGYKKTSCDKFTLYINKNNIDKYICDHSKTTLYPLEHFNYNVIKKNSNNSISIKDFDICLSNFNY